MNGPLLRDIHLPPASWWPPAPGWWCVAGIVVLGCLILVLSIGWRRRRSPLRAALREIDMLEADHAEDNDDARLAEAASREALDGLIDVRYRVHPSLDAPMLLAALRAWCRCALARPAIPLSRRPPHPPSASRLSPSPPWGEGRGEGGAIDAGLPSR